MLRRSAVLPTLLLALTLSLTTTGCKTPAVQTWAEWQATPVRPDSGLPDADAMPAPRATLTTPPAYAAGYSPGDPAHTTKPGFDLALRHPDFPDTHLTDIFIDLTDGQAHTRLVWSTSTQTQTLTGPWRVTVGRGVPGTDCDDPQTSNTTDTLCTPKGTFLVAGFADQLNSVPSCHYATWVVHHPRYIAIHSHTHLPRYPDSGGCIRMKDGVAKLIHNNSLAGVTRVHLGGRWKPREHMLIQDDEAAADQSIH